VQLVENGQGSKFPATLSLATINAPAKYHDDALNGNRGRSRPESDLDWLIFATDWLI